MQIGQRQTLQGRNGFCRNTRTRHDRKAPRRERKAPLKARPPFCRRGGLTRGKDSAKAKVHGKVDRDAQVRHQIEGAVQGQIKPRRGCDQRGKDLEPGGIRVDLEAVFTDYKERVVKVVVGR